MKKFAALSLLLLSAVAFVPSAEAKSASANVAGEPQINIRLGNQRNRRVRVRTYTRTVRRGRALYRETYRTTVRPNGVSRTQLISRVLVRRY